MSLIMVRFKDNHTFLFQFPKCLQGPGLWEEMPPLVREFHSQVPRAEWRVPGLDPWLQQHFDELSE